MPSIQLMAEMVVATILKISKRKYFEQYGSLTNPDVVVDEAKNKRGQIYFFANK